MRVNEVLVRFYRAFNYDYLRKYHDKGSSLPWEIVDDGSWYPFVSVPLAEGITTIVGANESGKSQILSALKVALTGEGAERRDFCRYSKFFIVDQTMRLPDFGVSLVDLTAEEKAAVAKLCKLDETSSFESFTLIRGGDGTSRLWIRLAGEWHNAKVSANSMKTLNALLPAPFEMRSDLPLPDLVPIAHLADPTVADGSTALQSRASRQNILNSVMHLGWSVLGSQEKVTASAPKIAEAFSGLDQPATQTSADELALAADLLLKIAGIGPEHFADLLKAIGEGRDGYVNGIQEQINKSLASRLNFRRWWTQDSSFQLRVSIREADLAFIIRDRTGTDYSFGERSSGLKYFLSYFVQYLAHDVPTTGSEVLLMDEPDTYLSSQGQRDLLRIFDALAYPEDERRPCPVVYVTHSPFLMDKNHAERIRVLEKGEGDEGTRVVRDAAQNHYEPLRSAFGGFVAETTFMGSCNLMIEGPADQILLAGISTWLRRRDVPSTEHLDLNEITLVPAGGASHIPYLAYLARGRDVEKPAVIVLLDGDAAGDRARKAIRRGGAYKKPLVDDDLVVQLSDDQFDFATPRALGASDIEDLIPLEVALAAAHLYVQEFLEADGLSEHLTTAEVDATNGVLQGVEAALQEKLGDPDVDLDKVGFARHVLAVAAAPAASPAPVSATAITDLESNFRRLFAVLGRMQRRAMTTEAKVKTSERLSRASAAFLSDHSKRATRAEVLILFEQIGYTLDSGRESEDARSEMRRLVDVHQLDVDSNSDVADFEQLKEDLAALSLLARAKSQVVEDRPLAPAKPAQPIGAAAEESNDDSEAGGKQT